MSKVVDYFLKYVAFDTQSAEDAGTVPSTENSSLWRSFCPNS